MKARLQIRNQLKANDLD